MSQLRLLRQRWISPRHELLDQTILLEEMEMVSVEKGAESLQELVEVDDERGGEEEGG